MPNNIIRTLAVKTSATASSATSYDLGSEAGKVLYTPNLASGATITSGTQTDVDTALNYLGESIPNILGDFAQVETSPATYAHSVGDFIVYNNKLYKVTSAISAGGSLVVGTNITQTTVGSQVTSLNSNYKNLITKKITVLDFFQFKTNPNIPNYTTGKKYLMQITSNLEGESKTGFIKQIFFIGDTNNALVLHATYGNGYIAYIAIQIGPQGGVLLLNSWKSTTQWFDASDYYVKIYQII